MGTGWVGLRGGIFLVVYVDLDEMRKEYVCTVDQVSAFLIVLCLLYNTPCKAES